MGYPYSTSDWKHLAALAKERDGHRCSVSRILGGLCTDTLHAHHLIPIRDGGDPLPDLDGVITTCSAHHPTLEALRRFVVERRERKIPPCRHQHRYDHARRMCRARRLREAGFSEEETPLAA